jgi:DNA-directed RNA polymerase beta' subunit
MYINQENYKYYFLKDFFSEKILNITLTGIENVEELFYIEKNGEWIIETNGGDFNSILNFDNRVDKTKTFTNNIWEIYNLLGIEACREYMINEFVDIMNDVNICHVRLLVDRMTHTGSISSISRYTLRNDNNGPICKATFEESMDNFLNSACKGDIENTKGVSASIVCGKQANIGTGMLDLKVDLNKLYNPDKKQISDIGKHYKISIIDEFSKICNIDYREKDKKCKQKICKEIVERFKQTKNII